MAATKSVQAESVRLVARRRAGVEAIVATVMAAATKEAEATKEAVLPAAAMPASPNRIPP